MSDSYYSVPVDVMNLLFKIDEKLDDVQQRITRIEAQDHSDSIKSIRSELEKERNERIKLQIGFESIRTKLAPIIVTISMAGAVIIDAVIKSLH